jgi:hypothetical protein
LDNSKKQLHPKKYLIKQKSKIFTCNFSQKTKPFQKTPLFFNFLLDFQLQDNHNISSLVDRMQVDGLFACFIFCQFWKGFLL